MNKVKASRLTFILSFSLSSIVIIIVLYMFVGRPVFKYADKMRAQFSSKQEQLQQAEALMRSLPDPKNALKDIERKYAEFRQVSGTGKQLPRIIQELGQSAAGRDINVISIKPKSDVKAGTENLPAGVKKLFLEVIFSASYQETGEYAKVLSDLPGAFTIETMTISRLERDVLKQGERTGLLNVSFILSTYMVGDL